MLSSRTEQQYYQGFIFALLLHAVLLIFIISHFNSSFTTAQLNAGQTVKIVQAYAVIDPTQTPRIEQSAPAVESPPSVQPPVVKPVEPVVPPKTQTVAPKEVAFKSKVQPKPEPVKKAIPQPKAVTKTSAKSVAKTEPKLTEQQRMAALAKKLQAQARQSLQQQVQADQAQLDQQAAQAQRTQGIVDKYKALILQKVQQNWVVPVFNKNISCDMLISLAPGGTVLDVKITRSSGNEALDRSAIQAVYKASPLPVPQDSDAFNQIRQFSATFTPESAVSK